MADVLKNGAEWLAGKLKAKAGRSIEYRRGEHTATITATVGKTLLKLTDEVHGVRMQYTDRDYLFTASDLVLNGSQTLPQRGDVIADAEDGTTKLFEVLPYGSEPVYKIDARNTLIRVHTKLTGTE